VSTYLLAIVAAIYAYVALEMLLKRDYGSAMAWFFYAMANVGFITQYILEARRQVTNE
jgi:hypothetical protein